jgi:CHAT domain-containing protein
LLHLQAYFIVGPTATKTELEKEDLSRFRVVHYAVHAVANPKQPDNAALILRSDPPRNNGFFEARDILRTRLNAELVVLSACDTAVGRLQGEEGIANLAQAFLIAGASSVVPTLWKVDDVYSLFLMKQFYARLSQGQDKAIALQGAKEDLLQKFGPNTDPAFWAGFTLIGDATGRIQLNQNIAFR